MIGRTLNLVLNKSREENHVFVLIFVLLGFNTMMFLNHSFKTASKNLDEFLWPVIAVLHCCNYMLEMPFAWC